MVIGLLLGLASPAGAQSFPRESGIGATPTTRNITLYFPLGEATGDIVFPAATGGTGTQSYSLRGGNESHESLGFKFDPATRTFSGTPTLAGAGAGRTEVGFDLYYTVRAPNGGVDLIFVYVTVCEGSGNQDGATVCSAPAFKDLVLTAPADQSYTAGTAITPLVFSAATGGTGTTPRFLYQLGGLPAGLSFDAATRTLSGTPTTPAQAATITYSVRDDASRERATQQFKLTVTAALALVLSSPTVTAIEGGTGTYTVKLSKQPSAEVTVTVTSGDTGAATVDKASLTFTRANWSTAQTVRVTGVEDTDIADETVTITHAASGHSTTIANATSTVTITDDEVVKLVLSSAAVTAVEGGTAGTYTVKLDHQPTGDVTVAVVSGDTDAATVNKASLTFSRAN